MAKKSVLSFKDSLDSLFDALETPDGAMQDLPIMATKPKTKSSSSGSKSFLGDLETFFKDTIEETLAESIQNVKAGKETKRPARRTKPLFGLDALIQSTVETTKVKHDKQQQRVTLTFDTEKLDKLNEIADLEQARIKDIINGLIADYINGWETGKKKK